MRDTRLFELIHWFVYMTGYEDKAFPTYSLLTTISVKPSVQGQHGQAVRGLFDCGSFILIGTGDGCLGRVDYSTEEVSAFVESCSKPSNVMMLPLVRAEFDVASTKLSLVQVTFLTQSHSTGEAFCHRLVRRI